MKLRHPAAVLISLLGLLLAVPATGVGAASADVQLNLTSRWGAAPVAGAWAPYVATVSNSGSSTFTGSVYLVPSNRYSQQPGLQYPPYRAHVTVPRGEQRSLILYVVDSQFGYDGQVRDAGGRVVANASASPGSASAALAVLSDLPQAAETIAAPLRALVHRPPAITRFESARSFPNNTVYLAGLAGVIIDQFDSAALSQTQVEALRSYVGLGGTLILAGGASWRRTLLPLPPSLLPLKPEATATASLSSLADLASTTSAAPTQVVTGELRAGRMVLRAADGTPLMIEAPYGAGRILQIAFDPLAEPFDANLTLAATAWSQAVIRAADPTPRDRFGMPAPSSPLQGGSLLMQPGAAFAPPDLTPIYNLLNQTPTSGVPPVGLLAGLLVFYVLLAGLVNYLALRAIGRRGLMWITTPAVALVFTAGAYAVGFGSRGSDYLDNEVKVQRLSPDGAVETQGFHGLFSPRRGDFSVEVPGQTLASTAIGGGGSQWADHSLVVLGGQPEVRLSDVPVWSLRPLQTLAISHPSSSPPALEAHLHVSSGRLLGTVSNHSGQTLGPVKLFVGDREPVVLANQLAAGRSLEVDLPVSSLPSATRIYTDNRRDQAATLGGASISDLSDVSVVAVGDTQGTLRVAGSSPSHSSLAVLVEPVQLDSADALMLPPRQRLVSSVSNGTGLADVYDFQLPTGFSKPVTLSLSAVTGQSGVQSVQVYDWLKDSWQDVAVPSTAGAQPAPVTLTPAQSTLGPGLVRVRVQESTLSQAHLEVSQR